jgi:H+-transporting ATPase
MQSRLAAIEDMAGMNILCAEKTGILTSNETIQEDALVCSEGENQHTLLRYAASTFYNRTKY